jgi:hypothetical protein
MRYGARQREFVWWAITTNNFTSAVFNKWLGDLHTNLCHGWPMVLYKLNHVRPMNQLYHDLYENIVCFMMLESVCVHMCAIFFSQGKFKAKPAVWPSFNCIEWKCIPDCFVKYYGRNSVRQHLCHNGMLRITLMTSLCRRKAIYWPVLCANQSSCDSHEPIVHELPFSSIFDVHNWVGTPHSCPACGQYVCLNCNKFNETITCYTWLVWRQCVLPTLASLYCEWLDVATEFNMN